MLQTITTKIWMTDEHFGLMKLLPSSLQHFLNYIRHEAENSAGIETGSVPPKATPSSLDPSITTSRQAHREVVGEMTWPDLDPSLSFRGTVAKATKPERGYVNQGIRIRKAQPRPISPNDPPGTARSQSSLPWLSASSMEGRIDHLLDSVPPTKELDHRQNQLSVGKELLKQVQCSAYKKLLVDQSDRL
jgi:hypothetical protein